MRFNTGIAAMMEFVNGAYKWDDRPKAALEQFVLLLAPYAPHLAEEMWQVWWFVIMQECVRCTMQILCQLSAENTFGQKNNVTRIESHRDGSSASSCEGICVHNSSACICFMLWLVKAPA